MTCTTSSQVALKVTPTPLFVKIHLKRIPPHLSTKADPTFYVTDSGLYVLKVCVSFATEFVIYICDPFSRVRDN